MRKQSGWQGAVIIGGLTAPAGGVTAVAMLSGMYLVDGRTPPVNELAVVVCAVAGAFVSGVASGPAFGRPGYIGWLIALIGAVVATTLGSLLGGLLMTGRVDDAVLCLIMVAGSIVHYPVTGLVWIAAMACVQLAALVLVPKVPADLDLIPGPDNLG